MVKTIRKVGKKVNLNLAGVKYSEIDKTLGQIKGIFEQIKREEQTIKIIQKNFLEKNINKEKQTDQIRISLDKIKNLLKKLDQLNIQDLEEEDILKITKSQIKFSQDLLADYMNFIRY